MHANQFVGNLFSFLLIFKKVDIILYLIRDGYLINICEIPLNRYVGKKVLNRYDI